MKSKARICLAVISFCLLFSVPALYGESWVEFAVAPFTSGQLSPDIDGSVVVWQEEVVFGGIMDWDILGLDISDPAADLLYVANLLDDQIAPVISGKIVAFSSFVETDYDIIAADISDPNLVDVFGVSQQIDIDEQNPAVHGNTVVWQDNRYQAGDVSDIDVFGADIHNRDNIIEFLITPYHYEGQPGLDQQEPAIWRNKVVCETNYFGDLDIMLSDIWLRDDPAEYAVRFIEGVQQNPAISGDMVVWEGDVSGDMDIFAADISNPDSVEVFTVAAFTGEQVNPDIDGNIVVWQDNYSGDWDIYGYNLTTGQEFVICDNVHNQKNPAISGNIVVWEDDRDGLWQIYAIELSGPEIADCNQNPAGDIDGNCKVDISDLAIMSANWLRDELTY